MMVTAEAFYFIWFKESLSKELGVKIISFVLYSYLSEKHANLSSLKDLWEENVVMESLL